MKNFQVLLILFALTTVQLGISRNSSSQEMESSPEEVVYALLTTLRETMQLEIRGQFNTDGNVKFQMLDVPFQPDFHLQFFENQLVTDELELAGFQDNELKEVLSKHKTNMKPIFELMGRGNQDATLSAIEDFEIEKLRFFDEMRETLLPFQTETLAQIQIRFLVRRYGLNWFLNSEPVTEFVDLSRKNLSDVRATSVNNKDELSSRIKTGISKTISDLLRNFDDEQVEIIKRSWPYLKAENAGDAELFRLHCSVIENAEKLKLDGDNSVFEKMSNVPEFKLNLAGGFEIGDKPRANGDEYVFRVFPELLEDEQFLQLLEISNYQLGRIQTILDEHKQEYSDSRRAYRARAGQFDSRPVFSLRGSIPQREIFGFSI